MFHNYPENMDSTLGHLRRATVQKTDDSGTQQILKKLRGLASEQPQDVYRPQAHGLSSHAPSGSEGLFLSLGGRGDRILALGFEHKDHRPKNLPEGGTALYDADGKVLKFIKGSADWDNGAAPFLMHNVTTVEIDANGKVTIKSTQSVLVDAPRVDLGGPNGSQVVTVAGPSLKVFAEL